MKKEKLVIALAQINATVGDFPGNLQKITQAMLSAQNKGSHLVVFPELALTGYPPKDLLFFPDFITASRSALNDLTHFSRSCKVGALIGTIMENPHPTGRRLTNSAVLVSSGQIVFQYDKIHLPNYDVFDEVRYFEPGKKSGAFEFLGNQVAIPFAKTCGMIRR